MNLCCTQPQMFPSLTPFCWHVFALSSSFPQASMSPAARRNQVRHPPNSRHVQRNDRHDQASEKIMVYVCIWICGNVDNSIWIYFWFMWVGTWIMWFSCMLSSACFCWKCMRWKIGSYLHLWCRRLLNYGTRHVSFQPTPTKKRNETVKQHRWDLHTRPVATK